MKVRYILLCLAVLISLAYCCKPSPTPSPITTTISGTVTDADTDKPIYRASVSTEPPTEQVDTDREGRFLIDVEVEVDKKYRVTASKKGYLSNYAEIQAVEGENRGCDIQLYQVKVGIRGRVTDASTDEPIAGATITTDPISESVETDSDGWYILDDLMKDTLYKVTATKEGYDPKTITINVKEAKDYQSGNIKLSRVQPKLGVSSERLTLRKDEDRCFLTIRNEGTGTLKWSIEEYPGWLTLSKAGGETCTEEVSITITVDRDRLPEGTYSATLYIRSNGEDREVKVDVEQPRLSLSTTMLDFGTSVSTLGFAILNRGTGTLEWTISENLPWLTLPLEVTKGSTTSERDSVTVTISREGLTAGVYRGDIRVTSLYGGMQTISVRMEFQPDTEILSGPSEGEEVETSEVQFTFEGRDIEGPVEFSYRITGRDWSPWSAETEAIFKDLDESSLVGIYVFEVRSRSSAGDVDKTPATRSFTINAVQGLWLRPRSVDAPLGSEFTLEIIAEEVENLMLAHLLIVFDPSKLDLIEITESGEFWEQNEGELVWLVPKIDRINGLVDISAGIGLGDPPGVEGTGLLGRLTFRAKETGMTKVTFDRRTELRDPNNDEITVRDRIGADVTVR